MGIVPRLWVFLDDLKRKSESQTRCIEARLLSVKYRDKDEYLYRYIYITHK